LIAKSLTLAKSLRIFFLEFEWIWILSSFRFLMKKVRSSPRSKMASFMRMQQTLIKGLFEPTMKTEFLLFLTSWDQNAKKKLRIGQNALSLLFTTVMGEMHVQIFWKTICINSSSNKIVFQRIQLKQSDEVVTTAKECSLILLNNNFIK